MSSKKCLTRVSHKSVKQELLNSVKQGCPTRVSPQCVNSGCLTSEFVGNVTNKYCLCLSTYVSAFGFVGFILFQPYYNVSFLQHHTIVIKNNNHGGDVKNWKDSLVKSCKDNWDSYADDLRNTKCGSPF